MLEPPVTVRIMHEWVRYHFVARVLGFVVEVGAVGWFWFWF
jgi:hypothetical protein